MKKRLLFLAAITGLLPLATMAITVKVTNLLSVPVKLEIHGDPTPRGTTNEWSGTIQPSTNPKAFSIPNIKCITSIRADAGKKSGLSIQQGRLMRCANGTAITISEDTLGYADTLKITVVG